MTVNVIWLSSPMVFSHVFFVFFSVPQWMWLLITREALGDSQQPVLFRAKSYKPQQFITNSSVFKGPISHFQCFFHHRVKPNYIKLKTLIPTLKKAIKKVYPESYFVGEAPDSSQQCACFVFPTAELFYLDLSTVLLCLVVCGQVSFPK